MNTIAENLNTVLEGSVIYDLLSDVGKNLYFPKGILTQTAEAKKSAKRFNATVGMAFENKKPILLPSLAQYFNKLDAEEIVTYAPSGGDPALREAWRQDILRKNPLTKQFSMSNPVVVPGLTGGIAQAADLFVNKNDAVVVPDMFWGNYRLIFTVKREGKINSFSYFKETDGCLGLNIEGFKDCLRKTAKENGGKVVSVLNFPNNPTGYSPTKTEAKALLAMYKELADEGIKHAVICDDAYFGLFFEEDVYPCSLFQELGNLHENILAIKVDGSTKEHYVWGFRLGFVTFAAKNTSKEQYHAIEQKLAGCVRATLSNCPRPVQSIMLKALKDDNFYNDLNKYSQIIKERYRKVQEILKNRSHGFSLSPLPFNSGYFMAFQYAGNAENLRLELLNKHQIGTIAIGDTYLRIAFSSIDIQDLEELYSMVFTVADEMAEKK